MSGPRARANHELYLARIVLAAWRRALEQEDIPASTLAQAFEPGAREHLIAAYGWFLLAASHAQATPDGALPRSCSQLPPPPPGKVLAGEINEFRQLEAGGWLAAMLQTCAGGEPAPRQQDSLATVTGDRPGIEQLEFWLQSLETLFGRIGDSLDEY